MNNLTREQLQVIELHGWTHYDAIGSDIRREVSHPNGVIDVYIKPDGAIYVEEGDDLHGYDLVPLADSFMAGILSN